MPCPPSCSWQRTRTVYRQPWAATPPSKRCISALTVVKGGGVMPAEYYVAWWNLENLFDEENAPPERRSEKVLRTISNDIVGWTPQLRDRKAAQLASVIAQMNGAAGPDFLGICEVENRFVIDLLVEAVEGLLPGRSYAVAHADTDDARGIDVAFLYDDTKFVVPPGETFFHVVMRRNATREIVQVNFQTLHGGRTWAVFGNHWPSRSGGQFESEAIDTLPARRSATSTNEPSRSTAPPHQRWRWVTSTTSRSTPPWSPRH